MKKIISVLILCILAMPMCFAEADLSQPVTNTSLKSEIHRGFLTFNNYAANHILSQSAWKYDYHSQEVIDKNILDGKDSDGFDLGVYFSVWLNSVNAVEHWKPFDGTRESDKQLNTQIEESNKTVPIKYYKKIHELQVQFGIGDQRLCEINNLDYDTFKPWFDKFENINEPSN